MQQRNEQYVFTDEFSTILNPLVTDAHYSERRDTLASLQNKPLEISRW